MLAGANVDEALRQRVRARLADLELLDSLENIRLEKMDGGTRTVAFDYKGTDVLYEQTFREAGLDVEALPVEEVGERIRRSTVAAELAAVLDHWAGDPPGGAGVGRSRPGRSSSSCSIGGPGCLAGPVA